MSLFNVFDIAGSAMSAQSVRLNTTASNLANGDSISSSIDQTYRARRPIFAAVLNNELHDQKSSRGVRVLGVVETNAPLKLEYMPHHPYADQRGYVHKPNVNMVEEMADMISASRSYQMNVQVANSTKRMLTQTLQMGKR